MRKRYPILATAAVVALITIPVAAQAHDGAVQASCSGASIHLTNYPSGGVITGTVDGRPMGYTTFEHTYDNTVQWDPTVNHSYDITVTANDNYPTKHYSEEITGCATTPSPVGTPQPSSEPSSTPQATREPTTPPASPSPSSTPTAGSMPVKPPVTAHPAPTASPTPAPTTPPRSTVPTSPKPTPRSSTTATDAPVATPVVAPAEFTG